MYVDFGDLGEFSLLRMPQKKLEQHAILLSRAHLDVPKNIGYREDGFDGSIPCLQYSERIGLARATLVGTPLISDLILRELLLCVGASCTFLGNEHKRFRRWFVVLRKSQNY